MSKSVLDGYRTETELACELNRSTKTLQRWRRERIGPPWVKVGNLILYPVNGFRVWLENHERCGVEKVA